MQRMEFQANRTLLEPTDIKILDQRRLKTPKTNLIPAICFYNGSFVPIHAGHLCVLEDAKNYIDKLGTHECLGAYISPSHSGYVAKKLKPAELIGAGHRLSMISLAIENLDWVMVDLNEIFQPSRISLRETMKAFVLRLHTQLPYGKNIDIFWLKGEDALFYTKSPDNLIQLGFHSIYVLNRRSSENIKDTLISIQDHHEKCWQDKRNASSFPEKFHLVQSIHMNLSSSSIRACAQSISMTREQLQSCIQLDSVTDYIIQHQLWNTRSNLLLTSIPVLNTFPNDITELTPELLSNMLSTYSGSSIIVNSYRSDRIGVGAGWNGSVYRLHDIQYSHHNSDHFPSSMVLKISSGMWLSRIASIEPEFYWKLAPRISNIEIPKCYYIARHSHLLNEGLLLLEDLSIDYKPLPPKGSLQESTIFFLIASVASLHAEFFQHPLLQQDMFSWLPCLTSTITHYHTEYTRKMADQEHIQLLQSKLSSKAFTYAKALITHIPHLLQTLSNEHYTLAHGDFWTNNIFIGRNQSHRLVLFDWQTCCRANGLIDIVFLLRLLNDDQGRLIESRALDLYYQMLVKYGVSHYDLCSIREDYYSLALPFMVVILSCLSFVKPSKLTKIIMMLEDIATYGNKSKRIICDCELEN
ncbi:hypothetical protein I4U23_012123 [Adineta vaga]|nr:hypothetical protein I4U23_012123 [Adineta vaga]